MSSERKPRGRPVQFVRAEALDALVELFWRRGYEGTTQGDMLDATGLSSSSLYHAFGRKTETFQAVLERYLELSDGMIGPLERGDGGLADVHALLDRIAGQLGGDHGALGCMVVAAVQDSVNHDPLVAALTSRYLSRMQAALSAAAARAQAAREPLPAAPEQFANALYAALLGVLVSARSGDAQTTAAMVDGIRALLPAAGN